MNPINRRSQKIICIRADWCDNVVGLAAVPGIPLPRLNEVFTVDNFVACPFCGEHHFLTLVERPLISCADGSKHHIAFAIDYFRPADERKADISDLVRAARDVTITASLVSIIEGEKLLYKLFRRATW